MRNEKFAIVLIFVIIAYGKHIMFDKVEPVYDWEYLEILSRNVQYKAEHEQFKKILEKQKAINNRIIDSVNMVETINFLTDSTENN